MRDEIGRLAEATGRWEDAIAVEAQRFTRTVDFDSKVVIACRAAALVEDKLKDRRRAFRAYLNAFRLAPENQSIVGPPLADCGPAGAGPGRRGRRRGGAAGRDD